MIDEFQPHARPRPGHIGAATLDKYMPSTVNMKSAVNPPGTLGATASKYNVKRHFENDNP